MKDKSNYQLIEPDSVGAKCHEFILTARSGKHALKHCLEKLGFNIPENQFTALHKKFLTIADQKKQINEEDLIHMLTNVKSQL